MTKAHVSAPFWNSLFGGLTFYGALPAAAVEHVGGELDERRIGFGLAQDVLVHVGHRRDYAEQGQGLAFPDGQLLSVEDDVAAVSKRIPRRPEVLEPHDALCPGAGLPLVAVVRREHADLVLNNKLARRALALQPVFRRLERLFETEVGGDRLRRQVEKFPTHSVQHPVGVG